jgi:ABC-type transport system substrate-binding protein
MRSFLFHFILCVACAHLFCGCEKEDSPASPPEQVVHNPASNVLAWPLSAPVTSFDPIAATNTPEVTVVAQVFDTLVRFDQSLSLAPGIAKKWKVDPTGREYTFDLKAGIVFHDGSALTATKVKLSLERLARAGKKTFLYKHLKMIEGCEAFSQGQINEISGIQVLDPLQLRILLSRPHAPFLPALGICQAGIAHLPENPKQTEDVHLVVGSGPFMVESADDKSITMRPFKRFVDGAPRIDKLIFKIYTGSDIKKAAEDFLAGELSVVPVFGPVEDMLRESTNNYTVIRRRSIGLFFYGFNMHKNAKLTAGMRKRIAHALDKRALFCK